MIKELEAIRDAIAPTDPEVGHEGQDRPAAELLADAYVAAHPEDFAKFAEMSIVQLVEQVDKLRQLGWEQDVWLVEAWLLHKFEPQTIGGVTAPQLRLH